MSRRCLLTLVIALSSSCRTTIAWSPSNGIAYRSSHRSQPSILSQRFDRTAKRHLTLAPLRVSAVEVNDTPKFKEPTPSPPEPPSLEQESELTLQQKIINGAFLAAAFGYALYTILNIDHGMTRGWTGSEIAMHVPLDNWGAYESYLANKPVVTKTLINVIIYLLGDWLAQTSFQGKHVLDFDITRTLKNGFIGLCFGPLVHEYYQFSDSILPPENGLGTRLEKIFMDQTLYLTVKCSIYISAVGLLGGDDWPTVQQRVKDKIGGVVITAWKFWPLVHCITYGLVPARHRILWVNSVDLIWNAILANQAQESEPEEETQLAEGPKLVLESSSESHHVVVLDNRHFVDDQKDVVAEVPAFVLESSNESHHVVVLDNRQFVDDQKDVVVDILTSSKPGSNMTAEALAI
jgi:protein Mpv17